MILTVEDSLLGTKLGTGPLKTVLVTQASVFPRMPKDANALHNALCFHCCERIRNVPGRHGVAADKLTAQQIAVEVRSEMPKWKDTEYRPSCTTLDVRVDVHQGLVIRSLSMGMCQTNRRHKQGDDEKYHSHDVGRGCRCRRSEKAKTRSNRHLSAFWYRAPHAAYVGEVFSMRGAPGRAIRAACGTPLYSPPLFRDDRLERDCGMSA